MGVEAVVFFRPELAEDFLFVRKQGMQLASKMRYMSAQMEALLTNDLWRRNAEHANRMARLLEQEVKKIPRVKIVYPVEANGVFAQIPREAIKKIQERYFFYVWSEEESVVRWMCSFDTTEEDVREFANLCREVVRRPTRTEAPRAKADPSIWRASGDGASPVSTGGRSAPISCFLAALTLAHRALCAAAILLRPAAEIVRFLGVAADPRLPPLQVRLSRRLLGQRLRVGVHSPTRARSSWSCLTTD